jgi:hypothetical protein
LRPGTLWRLLWRQAVLQQPRPTVPVSLTHTYPSPVGPSVTDYAGEYTQAQCH